MPCPAVLHQARIKHMQPVGSATVANHWKLRSIAKKEKHHWCKSLPLIAPESDSQCHLQREFLSPPAMYWAASPLESARRQALCSMWVGDAPHNTLLSVYRAAQLLMGVAKGRAQAGFLHRQPIPSGSLQIMGRCKEECYSNMEAQDKTSHKTTLASSLLISETSDLSCDDEVVVKA